MRYFKNNCKLNHKGEYRSNRIEVTDRVKDGRTDFFSKMLRNAEKRALDFANKRRTYVYPIFGYVIKYNKERFEFIGYGDTIRLSV